MIIASTMIKRDPKKLVFYDYILRPLVWIIPKSVRPNHITVLRMVLTPFVLILLVNENYAVGVPAFILVASTDALDGAMARIRQQITDWGTFYDPIADKLLVGSVILLILIKHVNPVLAIGVIIVELLLVSGGWYQRQRGRVVTANIWGKVKMFLEVLAVLMVLVSLWAGVDIFLDISEGTLVLVIIFAVISLLTYSL